MNVNEKMRYAEVTKTIPCEDLRNMDHEDLASEDDNDVFIARGLSI